MKKIFIIFLFLIITIFIGLRYEEIIINKMITHNNEQFYNEEENIDVFFIGTSRIYYPMSPMEIWNKYGIVTYNRGMPGQYYKLTYIFLKEVFAKFSPKVIVVDIRGLFTLSTNNERHLSLQIPSIQNYLLRGYAYQYIYDNLSTILENANIINRFHYRWKELHNSDFTYETFWKGRFSGGYEGESFWRKMHYINAQKPYELYMKDGYPEIELKQETITYCNMIVDLAKQHNCDVVFIKTPSVMSSWDSKMDNAFDIYAKKKGWNFLNYNLLYDNIHIDFKKDFMDSVHLNLYGGRKVMNHLIPYLIEHYNIPNRKNDPKYASWNEDYIRYARAINREEIRELKSFKEWQNQVYYDNYTMLISTNGDNVLNRLPQSMKDKFKSLGLKKFETDKKNQKYAAIIDNNQVFFEEVSDKKIEYKGRMKNIVNLLVSSENRKATINVSGKPRAKNKYGINFVIYDKVNREIVDSIWVDPAKPDEVRR